MRELNHAIEEVSEFRGFIDGLTGSATPDTRPADDYRTGENRAARRARQRAEKRNAKRAKRVAA